jgi:hypothetical protein
MDGKRMHESSLRCKFSIVRPHRTAAVATTRDNTMQRDKRTHLHEDVGIPPDIVGIRDLCPIAVASGSYVRLIGQCVWKRICFLSLPTRL